MILFWYHRIEKDAGLLKKPAWAFFHLPRCEEEEGNMLAGCVGLRERPAGIGDISQGISEHTRTCVGRTNFFGIREHDTSWYVV